MMVVDGKLVIEEEKVKTLKKAYSIVAELSHLEGTGLVGLAAMQARIHLAELCEAFDMVLSPPIKPGAA